MKITGSPESSLEIGSLKLDGRLFLAPVAGWTERVFRSLCIEEGAAFTCTELVSSEALVRNSGGTEILLRRAENEKHYAIQLFGADPNVMAKAASLVLHYEPAAIDINAGCPVPKVTKTGAGSALMKDPARLACIVKAVSYAVSPVPVTVKLRSGWDAASINYLECAERAAAAGAAMITLHPRTRAQGYEGKSNWEYIAHLAAALKVPVAGSGDLWTPEDAAAMLENTGCAAVMFARGAMGNPFVFSQAKTLLAEKTLAAVPAEKKIATALRHLKLLACDLGEKKASREMRKVFCAYTKGIPGSALLRNALVHADSIADYQTICLDWTNHLPDGA